MHSHYSLLKGTASVAALARQAAVDGMRSLALTDTNGLYGVVAFAQVCRQAGIQPIIGMTIGIAAPDDEWQNGRSLPQLTLLAANPTGYQSLCALAATLQAHPDREMRLQRGLAWADLSQRHDGLICIEDGRSGWMARFLQAGQQKAAFRYAGRLGAIFQERCYIGLEIQPDEDTANLRELINFGGRFGMQPVAAQPVRHLKPEDADLLPLLAAIDRNGRLDQTQTIKSTNHWLTPAEIADRFADFPDAIANVGHITRQCQPALPDGRTIWPKLALPQNQSAETVFTRQARAGLADRLPQPPRQLPAYEERLQRELAAIIQQGFAPLFLLVADIVRFARAKNIPVSTRGSVANSLTAYVLGITTVDPVAQGLLFERFLNPARANLPDIDLDFCSRRRDEVLHFVREKYGADRVAMVGTMNTMQPKSALRETAKAYGLAEPRIKQLSALVPRRWHPDPRRRELPDMAEVIAQLEDETERTVMRQAFRLVGQPHHLSLHPGGIVITPGPLTDFVPVQWAAKGYLSTQFDYRDVEAIGLPKIDLLGIRALTVLADTAVSIRTHHNPHFHLDNIPLDDPATADMLARGSTIGVFQCESSGAQRTLRQLKARTVRDLAVANAFFKPGPATGGMARSFIRRYRGQEEVRYLHPALEPILAQTQGVLLFQEQVLRLAVEIAGLSWAQADHLRRGMSKFRAKEMAAMQAAFVQGCQRPLPDGPALNAQQAKTLWEQVIAFAGYGFNQGHATAYADVSYRSAYLKAHYPADFLWARLMDRGGFHHPAIYIAEARRLGMAVRPPHVNVSGRKVTLTYEPEPVLWLGLGQVRDLRRKSIKRIVTERQLGKRPFASLRDLLNRVPLQKKETIHLIQCGALDGLGANRAALLAEAEEIERAGSARQMSFGFVQETEADGTAVLSDDAAQRFAWEKHLLGMPVSVNPMDLTGQSNNVPIRRLPEHLNRRVTLAGYRLPGWTGGKGWFLSDGDSFIIARGGERPSAWEMVAVNGRYRVDEWGGGWFQVE